MIISDDPFTYLCQDILVFEKLGKVLIMGDFNARVGKYQNTRISEKDRGSLSITWLKNCIVMDYGRILINVFPLTNVLTCLPTSGGGRVVDYVFKKACDVSMVNTRIGPLSLHWLDHKPLYLYIATQKLNINESTWLCDSECKKMQLYEDIIPTYIYICTLHTFLLHYITGGNPQWAVKTQKTDYRKKDHKIAVSVYR